MGESNNSAYHTSHISSPSRHVLVIVGPTASGKTPISLIIAHQLNAEIISADSRQIYKLMDIGTAKPSVEDRKKVKHYFVDELFPDQDFNAGEYGKLGRQIIDTILQRNKVPIVVGGSGLYIQALVDGLFEGPSADPILRKELYNRLQIEGAEKLLEELRRVDPIAASTMLPTNTRRIVRALEVYRLNGLPISRLQKSQVEINFRSVFVGLNWNRQKLYERINDRVESMLDNGLIEEVKHISELGYSARLNALQTVGYKEAFDFLDGKIDYNRMVGLIKQNSRRYAKRQLTWFRGDNRIRWFEITDEHDFSRVALEMCNYFNSIVKTGGFEPPILAPKAPRAS